MEATDPRAQAVLAFWFAAGGRDRRWFEKSEAFDEEVRRLIVLLDQFPRNMFRGEPRAFATDGLALDAARHALANGYDRAMRPLERMFAYLPFEHAESLAEQEEACELTKPLDAFPETDDVHRYAVAHRDVIARFGRFPHRNAIVGRASTAEEIEFLKGPGSSF